MVTVLKRYQAHILTVCALFVFHVLLFTFHPLVAFDGTSYVRYFDSALWRGHYPPGYSSLIWLFGRVFDVVLAGQIVSAIAGSLLFLPVHYLLSQLLKWKWAVWISSLLVCLNPLVFRYGCVVMSDMLGVLCIFSAIALFIAKKDWGAGIASAFGYLVRPEILLLAIVLFVLRRRREYAIPVLIAIVIVAGIGYHDSGRLLLTGKGDSFAVYDNKEWQNNEIDKYARKPLVEVLDSIKQNYLIRLWEFTKKLWYYGGPLLLVIPFMKRRPLAAAFVGVFAYLFFLPLFALICQERYVIAVIIAGMFLALSAARTKQQQIILLGLLLIPFITHWTYSITPDEDMEYMKYAGIELRQCAQLNDGVMDRKPYVACYSGGVYKEIPQVSLPAIFDSARAWNVRFLVVDPFEVNVFRPQMAPLLTAPDRFGYNQDVYSLVVRYHDMKIYRRN